MHCHTAYMLHVIIEKCLRLIYEDNNYKILFFSSFLQRRSEARNKTIKIMSSTSFVVLGQWTLIRVVTNNNWNETIEMQLFVFLFLHCHTHTIKVNTEFIL